MAHPNEELVRMYLRKSAKRSRGIRFLDQDKPSILGEPRLSQLRRPLAGAAVLGRLTEVAMTGPNRWTDGNGLAGSLQDVVAVDLTATVGRCDNCGRTAPAEARVFDHAPA